jgi:hypothetical protein
MKQLFILIAALSVKIGCAQKIENGNFENNKAGSDQINLSNDALNAMLPGVYSFGSYGDVDIINSSSYGGGGAQDKTWYIALTGGGTDIVSLHLTSPLQRNKKYKLTFYDRLDKGYPATPIIIGLSNSKDNVGTGIYRTEETARLNVWSKREFIFSSNNSEQFITVQMQAGGLYDWVNIDNFELSETTESVTVITPTVTVQKDTLATVFVKDIHDIVKEIIVGDTVKNSDPVVVKESKQVKFNSRRANGRRYKVQQTIVSEEASITLLLWDKNKVDGDLVSVYRDGEVLAEEVAITKDKREIKIDLNNGKNIITIFAINLGKIPPNTVAIAVKQKKLKPLTLVSDLKKSGALEITYKGGDSYVMR